MARRKDGLLTSTPFLLTLLCALLYFVALGVLVPVLPRFVAQGLGGNATEVGVVIGALTVTALALRPTAGRMTNEHGSRLAIMLGVATLAGSIWLYSLATSVAALIACRLLTGAGEAFAYVGFARLAYDLAPENRKGESTSYLTVALFGGLAIGPLIGEHVRLDSGYDQVFYTATAFALASLMVSAFLTDPQVPQTPRIPAPRAYDKRWHKRFVQGDAIRPAVIVALAMSGFAALEAFVPLWVAHLGMVSAGTVLAENALIILVIRLVGARLPDSLNPGRTAVTSLVLQTVGWTCVTIWDARAGLYVGIAFVAVGISLLYPVLFTLAINRAPLAERGSAVATMTMAFDVGSGVGPLLMGVAVTFTGNLQTSFAVAVALNVAALSLFGRRTGFIRVAS